MKKTLIVIWIINLIILIAWACVVRGQINDTTPISTITLSDSVCGGLCFMSRDTSMLTVSFSESNSFVFYGDNETSLTLFFEDTLRIESTIPMDKAGKLFIESLEKWYDVKIQEYKDDIEFLRNENKKLKEYINKINRILEE